MRGISVPLAVAVAIVTAACGSSDANIALSPPNIMNIQFAQQLGVDPATMTAAPSGLYYQDSAVGTGAVAQPGQQVTVHYTGWLSDGTKFDSSVDRDKPFVFQLGAGRVIRGWDEGVAGMKVGGTRKLVIPPTLGYGQRAVGPIPPNSVLVFTVELLGVQ